ncbi:MAG: DUF1287 domain-containing protein [Pseudomonadota bacterium]
MSGAKVQSASVVSNAVPVHATDTHWRDTTWLASLVTLPVIVLVAALLVGKATEGWRGDSSNIEIAAGEVQPPTDVVVPEKPFGLAAGLPSIGTDAIALAWTPSLEAIKQPRIEMRAAKPWGAIPRVGFKTPPAERTVGVRITQSFALAKRRPAIARVETIGPPLARLPAEGSPVSRRAVRLKLAGAGLDASRPPTVTLRSVRSSSDGDALKLAAAAPKVRFAGTEEALSARAISFAQAELLVADHQPILDRIPAPVRVAALRKESIARAQPVRLPNLLAGRNQTTPVFVVARTRLPTPTHHDRAFQRVAFDVGTDPQPARGLGANLSLSIQDPPAVGAVLQTAPQFAALAPPRLGLSETPSFGDLAISRRGRCTAPATFVDYRRPLSLTSPRPGLSGDAFGVALARAALAQSREIVVYSAKYQSLPYPMGDLPSGLGSCSDVVIRAYRSLGFDLQQATHLSRVGSGDRNIDHRRTNTLRRYFAKNGAELPVSPFPENYKPGDIVTYYRPFSRVSRAHVAIVSHLIAPTGRPYIVHNRGYGVQLEDALFVDRMTGHYRFRPFDTDAEDVPVAGLRDTIRTRETSGRVQTAGTGSRQQ